MRTRAWEAVAAVAVVGMFWAPPTVGAAWPYVVAGVALAAVTAGAMVLRGRLPFAATVTAGAATFAGGVLGVCHDPMLAAAWCLYPLAVRRARRTHVAVVVLAAMFAALALVAAVPEEDTRGLGTRVIVAMAALSVSWLLGTATGRQIESAREAERMRVQLAVARDVHDVVGHALGVTLAQSGVVLSLPDADEQELRETLAEVETHTRRALEDVQALVRTLRDPGGDDRKGFDGIPATVAATRAAGVHVETRIDVGDGVGDTAFQVVREALSNIVRHAPGATCVVHVHEDGDTMVVRVEDDGGTPVTRSAGAGVGLRGMRERVRLVGGTVTWGARPEGGFTVEARLPLESRGR
ncbi:sensor histidine kinase [Streptosporangium saharense]|uniref:sensor histidine kinase n=1 Tax=Streptosporangium saharense TaxID=1706840 RepID=UPI003428B779